MDSYTDRGATRLFRHTPAHLPVMPQPRSHLFVFHYSAPALSPLKNTNPPGLTHTTSTLNTVQISLSCVHTHTHSRSQAHSARSHSYKLSSQAQAPPGPPLPLPDGDVGSPCPWTLSLEPPCRPAVTGSWPPAVCPQPPDEYCLMWVTADLVSFTLIVGIFVLQK